MASATVDPTPLLQLESIPTVDLRLLSQSELYSLSLCSDSAFNSRRCDDVVVPKIDRSVFNESAGSRKQTYFRLRLAPASSSTTRRGRTPHLRSSNPHRTTTHPEKDKNTRIISLLKELFAAEELSDQLVPIRVDYSPYVPNYVSLGETRKRGRPRKGEYLELVGPVDSEVCGELSMVKEVEVYENVEDRDREIANRNVNVIDLVALGKKRKRGRPRKDERLVGPIDSEVRGALSIVKEVVVYKNVEDRDGEIADRNGNVVDLVAFGKKRKRGRPRKDEYLLGSVDSEFRGELNMVKEVVAYENVEGGDREIANRNGNVVDLVALGKKRKRGRPRKDEYLRGPIDSEVQVGPSMVKEVVVYENVEDRDREIANRNGNVVDLVALGKKRKRGRPRKDEYLVGPIDSVVRGELSMVKEVVVYENVEDRDGAIVNRNGNVVDLVALGKKRKRGRPRKDEYLVGPIDSEARGELNMVKELVVYENVEDRDGEIVTRNGNVVDVVALGKKRKRGRPRKDEYFVGPIVSEVRGELGMVKEDRDGEIANWNGNVVDLVALGRLEDPYGDELRRRTEVLRSEEELLGFLKGLNGQWGSRRKKKRIVDANEFGDVLPKGWKVMLSVKKKEGRVWLFCRRYISPSGKQFASCKEVSSYLLSVFGLQDANQPNCAPIDVNIQIPYKLASGNGAEPAVQQENSKESLVFYSSPPITSISSNHEKQATLKIGNPVEVQVGEIKCHICTLTFDQMDDLLHHEIYNHRRKRSKMGSSLTDGVIIRYGKYECQFCHKTFEERHRYNGHIGAHVKNQLKNAEASPGENLGTSVYPVPLVVVPQRDYLMQASNAVESKFDAICDSELNSNKFQSVVSSETCPGKIDQQLDFVDDYQPDLRANDNANTLSVESGDKLDRDCMKFDGREERADDATDVATKSSECLSSEAVGPTSVNNKYETFRKTHVTECVANGFNKCFNEQGRSSESLSRSQSLYEQIFGVSAFIEEPNQETFSEGGLLTANGREKKCDIENLDDRHITSINEVSFDGNEFAINESIFGSANGHAGLDKNYTIAFKQQCISESHSPAPSGNEHGSSNVENNNGVFTSILTESKQKRGSESNIPTPSNDRETRVEDNVNTASHRSVGEQKIGVYYLGSRECSSYARSNKDALTSLEEEIQFEDCSVFPSQSEQISVVPNHENVSTCKVKARQIRSSEGSLLSLCDYENKNYVDKVSTRKMEGLKVDEVQPLRNSALTVSVGGSHTRLNADFLFSAKRDTELEFCSLFPSGNEQTFCAQDNETAVYNSAVERCKLEKSASGSLIQSGNAETPYDAYNLNKIYSAPQDEPKLDKVQNSRNYELSLAFGNHHAGLDAGTARVEQERYVADSSIFSCGMEQRLGVRNNSSMIKNSTFENSKQGKISASDLCSSFNDKTFGFENNFPAVYPAGLWMGPSIDEVGNSVNSKFFMGIGTSHAQPDEDVVAGGIWRSGEENGLRSGLANTSTPLLQSSSCFRTFDIISDKGEDGLFRVNEKYDSDLDFEGLRSDRSEPVEYSFFNTQNPNSLAKNSKAFTFDTEMEQGFDSPFWLGKDALMPNIAGRNQVNTVCVWCRNEFYHEPVQSGTQTGEIGSMCPTCSAKISTQFNVF